MQNHSDSELSVFVNTSDNYSDCWQPFFKLFKKFWNSCPYPVFLNTEKKDFNYKDLNIRCTKVSLNLNQKLTWSQCLKKGLSKVTSPYILYLQEDYFLEHPVKEKKIQIFLDKLRKNEAHGIIFSKCDSYQRESDDLLEIKKEARFRVSLQAGLWKKEVLESLIREHEDAWQFESYGSKRSRKMSLKLYCINTVKINSVKKLPFPYKKTGVVSGKWVSEIVKPLFKKNNISINYSIRGFYNPGTRRKKKNFLLRCIDRLKSL